jgi:hypothetical protein
VSEPELPYCSPAGKSFMRLDVLLNIIINNIIMDEAQEHKITYASKGIFVQHTLSPQYHPQTTTEWEGDPINVQQFLCQCRQAPCPVCFYKWMYIQSTS